MFMKNIRGTPAYWKDQLLDLLARINTLGPPTFFLTLTANDMHWPELFQLINNKPDDILPKIRTAPTPSTSCSDVL